ncbi:hypothetical protein ACOMHN_025130 [Nucella lapillus]
MSSQSAQDFSDEENLHVFLNFDSSRFSTGYSLKWSIAFGSPLHDQDEGYIDTFLLLQGSQLHGDAVGIHMEAAVLRSGSRNQAYRRRLQHREGGDRRKPIHKQNIPQSRDASKSLKPAVTAAIIFQELNGFPPSRSTPGRKLAASHRSSFSSGQHSRSLDGS